MKYRQIIFIATIVAFAAFDLQAQDLEQSIQRGESARQRGEYAISFENFGKAMDQATAAGDLKKQSQVQNLIGQVHYLQAHYNAAIRAFRQAEKLAVAANDKREEARAWAFLGQLYWRVGKVEDAEMLLNDALEVFERTNDEINVALTLRFIGRLEDGRGVISGIDGDGSRGDLLKSTVALAFYKRSLDISLKIGDEEGEMTTLKEIGLTYQRRYDGLKQLEKAMSYLEPLRLRLKDSNHRWLYAVVLNNIANNQFSSKDLVKSLETTDEATNIFREIGDRQELREMLIRKVEIYCDLERFAEALPIVDECIRIADDLYAQPIGDVLDQSRYFESLIDSYRLKLGLLERLKRPREMFETFESMKSLTMRDVLHKTKGRNTTELSSTEVVEEKVLTYELNNVNRRIAKFNTSKKQNSASLAKLIRQLKKVRLGKEEWQANIAYKNDQFQRIDPIRNLDLVGMCSLLPDNDTAFVEYDSLKNRFGLVFVLSKSAAGKSVRAGSTMNNLLSEELVLSDGTVCTLNVTANKRYWDDSANYLYWSAGITRRIKDFRDQLALKSPSYKENARLIYDALLADVLPLIEGKKHLTIVPSGAVTDVSFQALMNEKGRFLVEDFSISYAPSLSVLAVMQENRLKVNSKIYVGDFLAFGNPQLSAETMSSQRSRYRSGRLENLPEAETEVKTIGELYQKKRIFIGKMATEEAWRREAPKYRFLHLATHGLSDADKPLYSHVLLSSVGGDDGLVDVSEITSTPLNAEMVVLSACETNRGREIDGEGIVGLAWGFSAAGVPTVVASSWKVESTITAEFMIDFYTDLDRTSSSSKAQSLRRVSIARIRNPQTRHPFYWSAFSLIGNWK